MAQGSGKKATGICKRFNSAKGFGFITCDDGSGDVFVHQTEIDGHGFRSLQEGESVEFDIVIKDDGRRKAVNVTGPGGQNVIGQKLQQQNQFNDNVSRNNQFNNNFGGNQGGGQYGRYNNNYRKFGGGGLYGSNQGRFNQGRFGGGRSYGRQNGGYNNNYRQRGGRSYGGQNRGRSYGGQNRGRSYGGYNNNYRQRGGDGSYGPNQNREARKQKQTEVCIFYNSAKGCNRGADCRFKHIRSKVEKDETDLIKLYSTTQFVSKKSHKPSTILSEFEFAKSSTGYFGSGATVKKIECSKTYWQSRGQQLFLSWHIGRSTGTGEALFAKDGSALLAVETLKTITFGNQKLTITDPQEAEITEDGQKRRVFKISLSNLPLNFDEEILTNNLCKLNLVDFIGATVFFDCSDIDDDENSLQLVITQLNSLLTPYNLIDSDDAIKAYPPKNGLCTAKAILKSMSDCLNVIHAYNDKPIEFGAPNGTIKIKLDIRYSTKLEPIIWKILKPEIQKIWNLVRWYPVKFYGVKTFLHDHSGTIVIIGSDRYRNAMTLARNLYEKLTKPLIFKYDNKAKYHLVEKYLKTKQFSNFKCCAVQTFSHSNTIKIYSTSETKDILKNAINKFETNIDVVNVSPLIIHKCLRAKDRMAQIAKQLVGVMDVKKQLVQVIYCNKIPLTINIEMKSDTEDNNKYAYADQEFIELINKSKECIAYIKHLVNENKNKTQIQPNNNDSTMCSVCLVQIEENEDSYELKECKHGFHSDCIEMQLNAACKSSGTRPIQCAKCNSNISLSDIKSILNSDDKYKQLLRYSVDDYVKTNPNEYRNCPTPDCKQIYWICKKNDDEKKTDETDGNIFDCSECLKQYCLNCKIDYHVGMSCQEYNVSTNSDQEDSWKLFLDSYNSDKSTKNCPNCGMVADKLPNTCNHATCVYCGAHFCWKDLWMDPQNNKDGDLVYTHMQSEHGGYY